MMDIYLIRYFLAVVESGNFTRAARNQNVTQPTLSAGVKKLEQQLGKPLFERSNKRVFLTDAGTHFLPHAKAILHEVNLAQNALVASKRRHLIRLGVMVTISEGLISRLLQYFIASHPDFEIELIDGTERELLNRLDDGSIDYAVTLIRPETQQSVSLYEEGYVFALKQGAHPTAAGGGVQLIKPDSLVERNMIVRSRCEVLSETSRYFTSHNIRPRLAYRTRDDSRALAMVAAGVGGALVPETVLYDSHLDDYLDVFKLDGFDHQRTIGLIKSKVDKNTGRNNSVTKDYRREFELSVYSFFRDSERSGLHYLHFQS